MIFTETRGNDETRDARVSFASALLSPIALVRDQYKGREMARIMSFVMTVFILVPVFAPAVGQLILTWANWQWIFVMFLILALVVVAWFWKR